MTSSTPTSSLRDKVLSWAKKQGIWFYLFLLLTTAVLGGGTGVYFSNLPAVIGKIRELQEELEGVSELSLPNILLNSSPDEKLVQWGSVIPDIIKIYLEESEGRQSIDDYIVSVSSEQEDNDFTLEIRVKFGDTLSPKHIKEYDFICDGNINDSSNKVGSCTSWAISEVEEQITFGDILDSQVKEIISDSCQKEWRIIQVEKSVRYLRGQKKGDTAYEVICVVKTNNYWSAQEVVYDEEGNLDIYPITVD